MDTSLIGLLEPVKFGIPGIVFGFIFLFFGRKLFWFLIGAMGFYLGLVFATSYLQAGDDWHGILIALCCGVAGVIFLYAIQKIALSILGFATGVFFTFNIIQHFRYTFHWWLLLIGGIIGIIIAASFFQVALILLSSLFGSYLVIRELPPDFSFRTVLYVVLAILGFLVQYSMKKKKKEKEKKETSPPAA